MTDPLITATRFLLTQLEWLRHAADDQGGAYAVGVFDEIGQCARRIRGLVDGPAPQRYLGPCGATIGQCPYCASDDRERREAIDEGDGPAWCDHGWHDGDTDPCEGDVYARDGAQFGRCRTCGTQWSTAERRIWLHEQARSSDLAWTARGTADALGLNVKTLRAWATDRYSGETLIRRAKLSTYWRDGDRLVPWVDPPKGVARERLHYVADVVELAKRAAEERAEAQARRERQHADVAG